MRNNRRINRGFVMSTSRTIADKLCALTVSRPDIPNPTVRVGAWIIGFALGKGGFPVELSYRQIQAATGCHNNTIRSSVEWLVDAGFFRTEPGSVRSGPHRATRFLEGAK